MIAILVAVLCLSVVGVTTTLAGAAGYGFLAGCTPVAPRQLPSGEPPGEPDLEIHGGLVAIWGNGPDSVEQYVDQYQFDAAFDEFLANATVRGQPAVVYRLNEYSGEKLGLAWREGDCSYSVYLAPSASSDDLSAFAPRY